MTDFTFLYVPAEILRISKLNLIEKVIIADIGYFPEGYRFSNSRMAEKFGVSRRSIINSIQRLRSFKMISDLGTDKYHRRLKLNGEFSALFQGVQKGEKIAPLSEKIAPLSEKIAPLNGENPAPIDNNNQSTRKRFVKPTLKQVERHIAEKGYSVNPGAFWNFYEANGWRVGRNPMKNWQAALARWNTRETKGKNYAKPKITRPPKKFAERYEK